MESQAGQVRYKYLPPCPAGRKLIRLRLNAIWRNQMPSKKQSYRHYVTIEEHAAISAGQNAQGSPGP